MATNITTSAEQNGITAAQMAKAREVDFVNRFTGGSLKPLMEVLGVPRRIPMMEGSVMYVYKTTGTLQSGAVAEGEVIPLSQYARTRTAAGSITLKKWRKASTAEAIKKSGYEEAVRETDRKLLSDVQKEVRSDFFTYLTGLQGESVTGGTLQEVLANSWGKLQALFEDDGVETVHFIHPLTIAGYLATAGITVQNAFGMNYVRDFLGLGTVVMNSGIPEGKVYSTAKDNLILYYLSMAGDIAWGFGLTADDSGLIGIKSGYPNEERAQIESLVMSGIRFLVEYADGVVVGEIEE
mgnify:CR=1 FL=1